MYFGMKKAFSTINVVSEEESEEETPVNFQIEYRFGSFFTIYYGSENFLSWRL